MRNVHAIKLYFKSFEIYHNISIYSQVPSIQYFPGAAAKPLGSARGALRAPRSTGWEPLVYKNLGHKNTSAGSAAIAQACVTSFKAQFRPCNHCDYSILFCHSLLLPRAAQRMGLSKHTTKRFTFVRLKKVAASKLLDSSR